jgi:hypothetical protein
VSEVTYNKPTVAESTTAQHNWSHDDSFQTSKIRNNLSKKNRNK